MNDPRSHTEHNRIKAQLELSLTSMGIPALVTGPEPANTHNGVVTSHRFSIECLTPVVTATSSDKDGHDLVLRDTREPIGQVRWREGDELGYELDIVSADTETDQHFGTLIEIESQLIQYGYAIDAASRQQLVADAIESGRRRRA